jgi:hypothetical protein
VQQGQQLPLLMTPSRWYASFGLLVECLLLAPTPDMASSCLPLMTLLLQQMIAARQLRGSSSGSTDPQDMAEITLCFIAQDAFRDVPAAVHNCMQQTASLKQRRQLLRLWAELLTTLMQGAGAWHVQRLVLQGTARLYLLCPVSGVDPLRWKQENTWHLECRSVVGSLGGVMTISRPFAHRRVRLP